MKKSFTSENFPGVHASALATHQALHDIDRNQRIKYAQIPGIIERQTPLEEVAAEYFTANFLGSTEQKKLAEIKNSRREQQLLEEQRQALIEQRKIKEAERLTKKNLTLSEKQEALKKALGTSSDSIDLEFANVNLVQAKKMASQMKRQRDIALSHYQNDLATLPDYTETQSQTDLPENPEMSFQKEKQQPYPIEEDNGSIENNISLPNTQYLETDFQEEKQRPFHPKNDPYAAYNLATATLEDVINRPPSEEINQQIEEYISPISKKDFHQYTKRINKDAAKYLINKAFPAIDARFASHKDFNSPLKNVAKEKLLNSVAKKVAKTETEMAMHLAEQHKQRQLQGLKAKASLDQIDKEKLMQASKYLIGGQHSKLSQALLTSQALAQLGANQREIKQAMNQEAANQAREQIATYLRHPHEILEYTRGLIPSLPTEQQRGANERLEAFRANLTPPAAIWGSHFAPVVKQLSDIKFSKGGLAKNASMEGRQLDLLQEIEPSANILKEPLNHLAHSLAATGAQYGDSTGQQYLQAHEKQIQNARDHRMMLMQQIQESRMRQSQLLQDFDLRERALEEQTKDRQETREMRLQEHRERLKETERHHRAMEDEKKSLLEKESDTKRKERREATKGLKAARRTLQELDALEKIVKETNTGPFVGRVKNLSPALQTKLDNKLQMMSNNIIMDLHQSMKNIPRSEGFLKMLQQTKPSVVNDQETNLESIEMMRAKTKEALEYNQEILKEYEHLEHDAETSDDFHSSSQDLSKMSDEQLQALAFG